MNDQPPNEDEVTITPPDFSLKGRIGDDIDLQRLVNEERVARGQQRLNDVQFTFLDNNYEKINIVIQSASKNIYDEMTRDIIISNGYSIRGKAESLGFKLLAFTLDSLCRYALHYMINDDHASTIMPKYANLLQLILDDRISDDGGDTGRQLLKALRLLVEHFHPSAAEDC